MGFIGRKPKTGSGGFMKKESRTYYVSKNFVKEVENSEYQLVRSLFSRPTGSCNVPVTITYEVEPKKYSVTAEEIRNLAKSHYIFRVYGGTTSTEEYVTNFLENLNKEGK